MNIPAPTTPDLNSTTPQLQQEPSQPQALFESHTSPGNTTTSQVAANPQASNKRLLPVVLGVVAILAVGWAALYGLSIFRQPTSDSTEELAMDTSQEEGFEGVQNSMAGDVAATTVYEASTDIQWEDDAVSYDVQTVYLTDTVVADSSVELPADSNYAVFAVQMVDSREFGEPRVVPVRNYLNIRRQSQDYPPLGVDTLSLSPGQSATVYVPFAVPSTEMQVTGLLGILRNPYVAELDFAAQAKTLSGTLSLETGFALADSAATDTEAIEFPTAENVANPDDPGPPPAAGNSPTN
ncbi:hypothetical protein KBC79_01375 [Candidatus Woesebacteria bacterium]|nr:hypothetical protein [Candidatus Woesebacteria bacterium]